MGAAGGKPPGRPPPLVVAFPPFGGPGWLGGLHYLTTLLSALHEHAAAEVEPLLVLPAGTDPDLVAALLPSVRRDPITLPPAGPGQPVADVLRRRAAALEAACGDAGVHVVHQHAGWLGSRFGIPTLAWLGDFQHRVLPDMFGHRQRLRRELRFRAVLRSAALLYVLSETDRAIGAALYPRQAAKLRALPFAVAGPPEGDRRDPAEVRARYGLPPKFFLFPGQHWRHKNHLGVIEAVALLREQGQDVVIASCGNPVDHRDPGHGLRVARRRAELGLEDHVRVLGVIPRQDVWALLRASAAVVNPSRYEGWSTPVEEAKSIGAPLLLSDLPVHREQQPADVAWFDPSSPASIAAALGQAWRTLPPGPRPDAEARAGEALGRRRHDFARSFVALAADAVARHHG